MATLTGCCDQVVAGLAKFAWMGDWEAYEALLASLGPLDGEDALIALRSASQVLRLFAAALVTEEPGQSVERYLDLLALFAARCT